MFALHILGAAPHTLRPGAPAVLQVVDGDMAFHQPQRTYCPITDSLDRAKDPEGIRWIWRRGGVFFAFYSEEEERRFEAACLGILDA